MIREEVATLAILNVTLCIIGLGIWAVIRTEDKPKNGGDDD